MTGDQGTFCFAHPPRERPPARSTRLLILACSGTKTDAPGYQPAGLRYNGPLWQTLRAADPDQQLARHSALSAKHGWISADEPIKNYDARLTAPLAARILTCGLLGLPPVKRGTMPGQVHPYCWLASMIVQAHDRAFSDIAICAGAAYLDLAHQLAALAQLEGLIDQAARVVTINAPIGVMRQQLRAWLTAP
jgi:hypothetical protein